MCVCTRTYVGAFIDDRRCLQAIGKKELANFEVSLCSSVVQRQIPALLMMIFIYKVGFMRWVLFVLLL